MPQAHVNARSAFKALLDASPAGQVWLPAYLCPEVSAVVPRARRRFYPVDATLTPRVDFLQRAVAADDLVLAVDYFGRPPGDEFREYAATSAAAWFVEDCAQAMETGQAAWGDWQLYSPRKLLGVADGGVLAARSARARALRIADAPATGFGEAVELARDCLARFEDIDEGSNDEWYALHRAKEAAMEAACGRISRLSWELLGTLDPAAIGAARKRNFALLAGRLGAFALLPDVRLDFVPLGFPVRVPAQRRAAVRERLIRERIFPAIHWESLPSPAAEFPAEHELAASVLTLPCDQRYSGEHMERVAAVLQEAMR